MTRPPKIKLNVLSGSQPVSINEPLALPAEPVRPPDVPAFDRSKLSLEGRPLRTSSYTIYVDLPGEADQMLLVHGYTGAYDRVSRSVVAHLRSLEHEVVARPLYGAWVAEAPIAPADSAPSDQTIEQLQKRGYLTPMTEAEEVALFTSVSSKFQHAAVHHAPSYVVMPTYQCNLRCAYCFQDHMRTDPQYHHLLRTMDHAMVDRIFGGMATIDAAHGVTGGAQARSIILFGGEPLLEASRPIIEYIVRKACSRGPAEISAITNATDLHAYEDLLGPGQIGQLQITVDGPPRVHDQRRIYADGSGSFDRIARNVTMALDRGVLVSIRMNIDRSNLPLLPELAEEFIARGWDKHGGFSSYVAPVHGDGEHAGKKTTFSSWQLAQAMTELKDQHPSVGRIGGNDDGLLARARQLFDHRSDPMPRFRSNFCGAHGSMYVIDAFGDIYACWERTGDPSLRIGTIDASGTVFMNRALLERWRSRSVASNPVCRKCRYAMYCGGGCAVLAEAQHGDIHANHCDGFGRRFRASVAEAYLDHVNGVKREINAARVCDM